MTNRDAVLARLNSQRPPRGGIIGAGAGTGISGKIAIEGGADFLVVYNSGKYRMAGRSSLAGLLAYGDANATVLEMAAEVVPVAKAPVFAGVNGTDPFRVMKRFLGELRDAGFQGVQNFPTVGVFDGIFRENLQATGLGYEHEVAMISTAKDMDLVTAPYAFTTDEVEAMTGEGRADILVTHLGLTTGGSTGAGAAMTLSDAAHQAQNLLDAARRINPDVIVLAHGGPISTPQEWQYLLNNTEGFDGFLGASSMERLPAEVAIRETVSKFKAIRRG